MALCKERAVTFGSQWKWLVMTWAMVSMLATPVSGVDSGHDWPQFLGPLRNGLSQETGLLDDWPASGPKVVWRTKGGVGMSGLVISRGRLVTLVQHDGQQFVLALDAQTSEPKWQTAIAPEYRNQMGNGPRATPTILDERVFVFTGEGTLAALSLADGTVHWTRQVVKELGGDVAEYGMACSPLVVGQQVVVTVGAPRATVAAYEVATGKLAWTAGEDVAGYSSPALLHVGGREQLVVFSGAALLGLAPHSGELLWRYPFETNFECNIATPLVYEGNVLISSGEDHGSVLLSFKAEGDEFKIGEVWSSLGNRSVLRSEWQTPILLDGHFYGMDNVGGAGPITHLTCIEGATGKRVWQQSRFGKGNLIAADGKLFISTMKGELVLARATPERYEEIGRAAVMGSTRQAPALANGLLYLRDDREIVCLDVRR